MSGEMAPGSIESHTFRPGIDQRCTAPVLIASPFGGGLSAVPCGRRSYQHAYTPTSPRVFGCIAHGRAPDEMPCPECANESAAYDGQGDRL